MKRLTKKSSMFGYGYGDGDESRKYNRNNCCDTSNIPEIINKLGQIEDIEQKLGCPLDLYCKMCIFGTELYCFPYKDITQQYHKYIYVIEDKCFCLIIDTALTPIYYVKDYGKTWSLKKEELL